MIHEIESYLASVRDFDWRTNNCCHFVDGWVKRRTGRSHMEGLPETPTPLAAARLKRELGGDLCSAVTRLYGPPVPAEAARCGDIVRIEAGDVEAMGIFNGATVVCLVAGHGMMVVGKPAMTHAWRVA